MRIEQLKRLLFERGMRNNAASFSPDTLTASEQYRLSDEGEVWEVYYFERGNKNNLRRFFNEDSACKYLLSILLEDKTVWQPPSSDTTGV